MGENIMKTDLQLQRDVLEELKFEPSIREAEIGVAAKGGVVTLTGIVDSYAEKFSAERTAERVGGVKAVADELKVKLPGSHQRSDTDIAHAAVNALRWDIQVPDDRIKATIEDGWIALEGEVEWQYQKADAWTPSDVLHCAAQTPRLAVNYAPGAPSGGMLSALLRAFVESKPTLLLTLQLPF